MSPVAPGHMPPNHSTPCHGHRGRRGRTAKRRSVVGWRHCDHNQSPARIRQRAGDKRKSAVSGRPQVEGLVRPHCMHLAHDVVISPGGSVHVNAVARAQPPEASEVGAAGHVAVRGNAAVSHLPGKRHTGKVSRPPRHRPLAHPFHQPGPKMKRGDPQHGRRQWLVRPPHSCHCGTHDGPGAVSNGASGPDNMRDPGRDVRAVHSSRWRADGLQ